MPVAVILSGAGRYADPWHPFPATSRRLQALAAENGYDVTITEDIDETLAQGLAGVDLLIVNAGDPARAECDTPDPALLDRARAGLATAVARGMSLLGLHAAASTLRDYPDYRALLGGEWVVGQSWHPPQGEFHVRPLHDAIVEGLGDFTVIDERYTGLTIDRGVEPLAASTGEHHVLAWANQVGPGRAVYSALGHDERSYDSAGHRALLRRALSWLFPRPPFADKNPDKNTVAAKRGTTVL
ncbi:MAG: ThuA domain-containing protein [Propionibacteriaceae bacterium]|jgi:type 1 glutamine amidotransferase|nr:ThuA domain-containing protein [Propionibacteriaceae bacterium]